MMMITNTTFSESKGKNNLSKPHVFIKLTLENMDEVQENLNLKLSRKKSILRKESLLDGSMLGWKLEKKKSVLFKTG